METKVLVQQDTRVLGSIDIWICYFEQDLEYLDKLANYLSQKVFE